MKITKGEKSFTIAEAIRYKLQTIDPHRMGKHHAGEPVLEQKVNNLCNMMGRLVEVLNDSGDIILDEKQMQAILGNDFTIKED